MKTPVQQRECDTAAEDPSVEGDAEYDTKTESGPPVKDATNAENADPEAGGISVPRRRVPRARIARIVVFGLFPTATMTLTLGAAVLKWQANVITRSASVAAQTVRVASDGAVAILSYRPETVEQDLDAASARLTGEFRDAYNSLTHDVVIPGAKQKHITASARVPAAASVRMSAGRAVVLVFVDQTTTMGSDPPTDTTSCVRVTLDKRGQQWLISAFDPI